MCLLYSLWMLRRLFKLKVEVYHFDHKLRPDSAKDAQYVKRAAAKLNLPFHLREARGKPQKGESPEDWARGARWNAIGPIMKERPRLIAFGHTMDDQAETVLLALMRGGGLQAVAGIEPRRGSGILIRPLIDVRRAETHAFCRALRLRPRVDETNLDTSLMRNALRLRGMPALERAVNRDIVEPIARSAALLQLDEAFMLRRYMEAWDEIDVAREPGTLPAEFLSSVHPALAGRLVHQALAWRIGRPVERAHVLAMMDLAKGRPGRRVSLPGGFTAVREREYIRISSPDDR